MLRMELSRLRSTLPEPTVRRLPSGLTVCIAPEPRVETVAVALWYRAGTRDEEDGRGGTAHFLEHMMFKGSGRYGPGEIDHLTQALGGSNNAFTSHDATVYHFVFAADRWTRALDVEADRMAGLLLDASEVANERQVILEEIAMYEGEPWDALEQAAHAVFYPAHPYGRPVLGTRDDLDRVDADVLRRFHAERYRPSNAVLVVTGHVGLEAGDEVAAAFDGLGGDAPERETFAPNEGPEGSVRVVRHHGEVPRLLLVLPAPGASHPDHPVLRLLAAVLATGRSSRLHRALVDEGQLAVWVSVDLGETVDPAALTVAVEVLPGTDLEALEAIVLRELRRLREEPPSPEELARARRMLTADWVFDHQKPYQQALLLGAAIGLFDLEHPWRYLERLAGVGRDDLLRVARQALDPERASVVAWSLPDETEGATP